MGAAQAPRTAEGQAGLEALRADPARSLVALDYDGTLSPIVSRPENAVPADGMLEVLISLAGKVGRLALLTGRPAQVVVDLGGLARVPGLVVLGQYGVERWEDGRSTSAPPVAGLAEARAALPALVEWIGAEVEDRLTGARGAVHHVVNIVGRVRSCSPGGAVAGYSTC